MEYFKFFPEKYFTIPNDEQVSVLMPNIFKAITIPSEVKTNLNVTFRWTNSLVLTPDEKIGRASCRERVCLYV